MESNLQNYTTAIFEEVKQIYKNYHLIVKGDIMSLGMAPSQFMKRICAKIGDCLHAL